MPGLANALAVSSNCFNTAFLASVSALIKAALSSFKPRNKASPASSAALEPLI